MALLNLIGNFVKGSASKIRALTPWLWNDNGLGNWGDSGAGNWGDNL